MGVVSRVSGLGKMKRTAGYRAFRFISQLRQCDQPGHLLNE